MSLIRKIYDEVHMALWAVLAACVLWFLLVAVPKLPEARARADALRVHEINEEQDSFCGQLGMGAETPGYRQCLSRLQEYRARIERRIADESQF